MEEGAVPSNVNPKPGMTPAPMIIFQQSSVLYTYLLSNFVAFIYLEAWFSTV